MANIEVTFKETGQRGMMPEENFDPNLFEKVGTQTEQPKQSGLLGILKSALIDPAVNYGKYVAQAGQSLSPTMLKSAIPSDVRDKLGLDKIGLGGELTPEETAKLAQTKTILPEEKIDTPAHTLETGARATAGAAALAMPVGKTIKGAAGLGALAGGLGAYGSEEGILGGILGGGITGGAIKGVGNKLPGIVSKTGKETQKLGSTFRGSIQGFENVINKDPYFTTNLAKMAKAADDLGLKGTARNQLKMVNEATNDITKKILPKLENSEASIPSRTLYSRFAGKLKDAPYYDITDPKYIRETKKILNQIEKKSVDGKITPLDLFKAKQEIGQKYAKSFTRAVPNEADITAMGIYNEIRNVIDEMVPGISNLTKKQSEMFDISKALGKTLEKPTVGIGPVNIKAPGIPSATQTLTDLLGRTTGAIGRGIETTGSKAESLMAGSQGGAQALSRLLGGKVGAQAEMQATNESQIPAEQQVQAEPQATEQPSMVGGLPRITDEILLQGRLQLGDADYEKLVQIKELQDASASGGANVGKVSAQNFANAKTGAESLGRVNELIFNPDGSIDRNAIAALKTPGRPNEKSRLLAAQLYNVADAYLRLRTGAQANPSEIQKLADNLEPGLTDSKKVVEEKLNVYQSVFDEITKLGQ